MTFPLTSHPTWSIRDSSKVDEFIACPRMYFYKYVLGWRMDTPAHDLHFGHCWHLAREYQLLHGYDRYAEAFEVFETAYRKEFPQETDHLYAPKTPTGVLNALIKFATERSSDLIENEVVEMDGVKMTEISGTVPIDHNRYMHYRLDDIMRRKEDGRIFSWDHKTSYAKYVNNPKWAEQYHLSIQNGTYTHCLYCLFPIEEVLGIEFCQTGFEYLPRGSSKRPAGFHCSLVRVPAYKDPEQMNVWLWNINNVLDNIEREMDRLFHCKESDAVLMSFPLGPNSCTSYRGCPYHDFCLSWSNPLQRCGEPPIGFKQEFWDPSEREASVRKNLEWR